MTILLALLGAAGATGWELIRTVAWANVGAGALVVVVWIVVAVLI